LPICQIASNAAIRIAALPAILYGESLEIQQESLATLPAIQIASNPAKIDGS
jgi:hypothetical protein